LRQPGFTIAATVHILNAERFELSYDRQILTALYRLHVVVMVLVVDLGASTKLLASARDVEPSFGDVKLHGASYSTLTVLTLNCPVILEKFHLHAPIKILRTISLPVVVAGVILSTLHQSSFGSLYLVVPERMHRSGSPTLFHFSFSFLCASGHLNGNIFIVHGSPRIRPRNRDALFFRISQSVNGVLAFVFLPGTNSRLDESDALRTSPRAPGFSRSRVSRFGVNPEADGHSRMKRARSPCSIPVRGCGCVGSWPPDSGNTLFKEPP